MEPSEMTLQALGQVATSVGLSAGLILFFVWQTWKREERTAGEIMKREASMDVREERTISEILKREALMDAREDKVVARLQELETFTRTTLISLTEKTTMAITQNTLALNASTTAIETLSDKITIRKRPPSEDDPRDSKAS